MRDSYTWTFYQVVKDVQAKTGLELPQRMETHITLLLAQHMDKVEFLPKKSFIETYLELQHTDLTYKSGIEAVKKLADQCLFLTGVFPDYNKRYGFSVDYFSTLGQECYSIANSLSNDELFSSLSKNFTFARDFISVLCNKKNSHQFF